MKPKHFLMFQIKSVCYDSYSYFSDALAAALTAAGHSVEVFSVKKEPPEAMERFCGMTFDAAVDFNSELPKLKMDDGTYFLDQIHAPFFDVILDHPLYHHDTLKQTPCNFHVLCLDRSHAAYIRHNYPHIVSAELFPVTGEDIRPEQDEYPKKAIDLLFSGTYTSPKEVDASILAAPGFLGTLTRRLIELMQKDRTLTQEDALLALAAESDEGEIIRESFALHMQACFLCDSYLRASEREKLLLAVASEGLPLTLCGNSWRNSPLAGYPQVRIIDDLSFCDTFPLFYRSKITLNLLPEFKDGTHDRVYSAMLNHSLCLTDASPLLREQFTDGTDICFYDAREPEKLTKKIKELLDSPEKMEEISQAGYRNAKRNHTWDTRAASFLAILDSVL